MKAKDGSTGRGEPPFLPHHRAVPESFAWQKPPEPFVQSSRQLAISDRQENYGIPNYTAYG